MIQRCPTYSGGVVCSPKSGYRRVLNIRLGTRHWRAYIVESCHPGDLDDHGMIVVRHVESQHGQLHRVQVNGIWYKLAPLLNTNPAA
jgi:hypothetical protein